MSGKDRTAAEYVKQIRIVEKWQKRTYEQAWYQVSAMLLGRQHMQDRGGFRYSEPSAPPWQARTVANRLLSIYQRELSRLTSRPPIYEVVPANNNSADKERATLATDLLNYQFQHGRLDLAQKRKGLVSWALRTGTGFLKVTWDPDGGDLIEEYDEVPIMETVPRMEPMLDELGDPVVDPMSGEMIESPVVDEITGEVALDEIPTGEYETLLDENDEPVVKEAYRLGEVDLEIISPFDIFVDDRYETLDAAPYVMHYYIARLDEIKRKYPKKAKELQPHQDFSEEKHFSERLRSLVSPLVDRSNSFLSSSAMMTDKDMDKEDEGLVMMYEVWIKPDEEHPRGRLIIVANGDVVLFDGQNPYRSAHWHPFVEYKEIEFHGRYWGMSTLEQLVGLQRSYNRVTELEEEDIRRTSRPMLMLVSGSGVKKSDMTNEPGWIGEVRDPKMAPFYVERRPTEMAMFDHMQKLTLENMDEIASQHDVTRGQAPKNIQSGLGASYIAQKDDMATAVKIDNLNRALERIARLVLERIAQFQDDERIIKVGGETSEIAVKKYKGSDLQMFDSGDDYFDVRIIPGSTMPVNKAAARSETLTYIQMGILNPVTDRPLILRMLDLGNNRELFENEALDEAQAKKEIELIKSGEQVRVWPHQNHTTHQRVFHTYMLSPEFYELDPQIQEAFFQHLADHEMELDKAIQKSLAMQQGMMGGGEGDMSEDPQQGGGEPPDASKVGRQGDEGQSMMTEMGGAQRGQKMSDMRGMYGGTAYAT